MTEPSLPSTVPHVSYESICNFDDWATLNVDAVKFEVLLKRLRAAGDPGGGKGLRWAQDRILRATAFETGAVEDLYDEGATQSVAMESDGWEQELADSGDGAGQHFEDQLAAYLAVRDLASADLGRPLAETDIRELHRVATRSQRTHPVQTVVGVQQQPYEPGAYKTKPNHVRNRAGTIFHYAPVEDVAPEMKRLVDTMRTESFRASHPVIQCAYVHWAVAHVHPFADGNGRMARVVGSIPLLAEFGIPLVVFAGRKRLYLQALEAADRHAHQEMVDYVAARALETYSWLAELMEGAKAADSNENILGDIERLLRSGDEPLETSMEAAERLKEAMFQAIENECTRRFDGTKVRFNVAYVESYSVSKASERAILDYAYTNIYGDVEVILSADEVDKHETRTSVQCGYTDLSGHPPLAIQHDAGADVYFNLEDCSPDLSVGADLRLRNLAATVVADVTQKFSKDLANIFKSHGRLPSDGAPE
ncbi:Fic family protein [Arthrobacter sp. STN4]|uniref:Fic family protein n=1 Tax=Arthrobacter sp. STN4 TaxID=2923276 RepID=UPI00211A105D|nr:Fic family protein [Arthrobacter sp. STN4]MCQ9162961.1 Fic family protein [Arthrobacter sp. STN4]